MGKEKTQEAAREPKTQNGETDAAHAVATPRKGKKIVILGALALLLLLGAGGGLYALLSKNKADPQQSGRPKNPVSDKPIDSTYVDMDEFLVNLDSATAQPHFLKMVVTLEVPSSEAAEVIKHNMPRIRDSFYIYLRELRIDDLRGAAGLYRLREELLLRLNMILYPVVVSDVLFREIVIQ